jgi:hypothetical protein
MRWPGCVLTCYKLEIRATFLTGKSQENRPHERLGLREEESKMDLEWRVDFETNGSGPVVGIFEHYTEKLDPLKSRKFLVRLCDNKLFKEDVAPCSCTSRKMPLRKLSS